MDQGPSTQLRLVSAGRSQLDGIMEIERLSFPRPWSRQVFVEEIDREISTILALLEEPGSRVVAYIAFWIVYDELHVLNLATHPALRRRGLARRMIQHAVDRGLTRGVREVTLEVRRSNASALGLYKGCGFTEVGIRRRYYENDEDAILMTRWLEPVVPK